MIDLSDITLIKNGREIYEALDLSLLSGENYVLHGANGSGKTMLFKLITGHVSPYRGKINYSFIDPSLDWEVQYNLRKKYIHEIPAHALHELMGTQNLYYQQRYYSIGDVSFPRVKDLFGERLEKLWNFDLPSLLQITPLLDLELTRLSNGQIKKIIIISKLLDSIPKILLLDYPFEGLDAGSRSALCDFLDHLSEAFGIQIILTDHHHALPKCITHKLVLRNGKITKTAHKLPSAATASEEPRQGQLVRSEDVPVVEVKNLTIRYGDQVIVDNLNWKINRGERWALTGRNGSGKTTLFSLIYADHPMAYSQDVNIFGKRRGTGESIWDIKSRINYMGPEQIHFLNLSWSPLTVAEYITDQKTASDTEVQILISFFNAAHLMQRQVRYLSSGELQLILLVIFFLSKKELLLLDEPFQFLDPVQRERVSEYLNHYMDGSSTLVMITHDESDIGRWTNHRLHL